MSPERPPHGIGGGASPHGAEVRARLEALGRASADLLHDLSFSVDALESRARLAAAEARAGRVPLTALSGLAASATELRTLLHDALAALRGEAVSPEVTFDVHAVCEETVRRLLPHARSVVLRVENEAGPEAAVCGRASFLARALAAVLRDAALHARSTVRVAVRLEEPEGQTPARVVVRVEHDGGPAAVAPRSPAAAAWLVQQLRGELLLLSPERPNLAPPLEIRLPAAGAPGGARDGN